MTDNEIIKALECCVKGLACKNCPANPHKGNYGYCTSLLLKDALDLINRQKAENERLTSGKCVYLSDDEITEYCVEGPCPNYKTEAEIKAEAYKEFAERLKDMHKHNTTSVVSLVTVFDNINILVKEMVGDN